MGIYSEWSYHPGTSPAYPERQTIECFIEKSPEVETMRRSSPLFLIPRNQSSKTGRESLSGIIPSCPNNIYDFVSNKGESRCLTATSPSTCFSSLSPVCLVPSCWRHSQGQTCELLGSNWKEMQIAAGTRPFAVKTSPHLPPHSPPSSPTQAPLHVPNIVFFITSPLWPYLSQLRKPEIQQTV